MKVVYLRVKEQPSEILTKRLRKIINWMQIRYNLNFSDIKFGYINDQLALDEFTVRIIFKA